VLFLYTNDEKMISQNHNMAAITTAMVDITSPLGKEFSSFASRKNSTAFTEHAISIEHHIVMANNITINS